MIERPIAPGRETLVGRATIEGKVVHVLDALNDPEYTWRESQLRGGYRTMLGVPLMREGIPVGVLSLTRTEVKPFTDRQIELLTTFADQAVIAIENVRLFDEIQDKSRQLEVASQHKSQFLANMSHELRTPLNAILGYTELIADGIYGEPSEKMLAVLKRLESNGKHLLGLINDVLDLSKIEAGQLVLELTDYSIEDIAQTVRSTLEPLAADKKLAFKVEVAPKMPAGHGDGRRLTQVLINLVGNAIKFTDAGEVVIKATATDGSFQLSVCDTGPGIFAADQAKLFQEFQQADNAITRKKGGTGLGLAISKRIIEMHGGKIWVESQVGQGSTFSLTVPVRVERQVDRYEQAHSLASVVERWRGRIGEQPSLQRPAGEIASPTLARQSRAAGGGARSEPLQAAQTAIGSAGLERRLGQDDRADAAVKRARSRKIRRQLLGSRLFHLGIHHRIRRREQLGGHVIPLHHRIVGVAVLLEEIGRRHLVAPVSWHRHHVETVAVAGQVHHLSSAALNGAANPLRRANTMEFEKFLSLQQRAEIQVEVQRMDGAAFLRSGQRFMLAPPVRHAFCKRDHFAHDREFPLQGFFCRRLTVAAPLPQARR